MPQKYTVMLNVTKIVITL